MKTKVLLTLLVLSMLLAACADGKSTAPVVSTVAVPQATNTSAPTVAPTVAPSPTAEQPAAVPPPEEDLLMLRANPWQWVSFTNPVEQYEVDNPRSYTVTFNNDATVNIVADCNNASGSYVIAGTSITIQVGPMTLAACPESSRSDDFVKYLGSTAILFFKDGHLLIDLMADGGTMEFAPASETGMAGSGSITQAGNLPRFEPLNDCFTKPSEDLGYELDLECGYVVVPEFHNSQSGREIKLGITRLKSGNGTAVAPLFMLSGGPGQAHESDFFALFNKDAMGKILENRDIVLVEQRGTKYTEPVLDCAGYHSAKWDAYEQGISTDDSKAQFLLGVLQECISDLKEQGVNFDAYNSVDNAADINDIRDALGYEKIIYYGGSYGSQLGQHVMRDYPDILEAVVLDGANSLSRKSWVEDRALDFQWGIDNLTKLCEADAKCKETYDIPALIDASLALFDNGPLPYAYTDPNDPALTIEGSITKQDFANMIYTMLGNKYEIFGIPWFLDQIIKGDDAFRQRAFGELAGKEIVESRGATQSSLATLMHYAVVCSDDAVKSTADVITTGVGELAKLFGQAVAQEYENACALLNVEELPDSTDVNVTADIPTLILTGELDVATPVFRSQLVVDALPKGTLITFPGGSHVQIAGSNYCAAEIMTQFVADPTAELDTSCLAETPVSGFILPDGSLSK